MKNRQQSATGFSSSFFHFTRRLVKSHCIETPFTKCRITLFKKYNFTLLISCLLSHHTSKIDNQPLVYFWSIFKKKLILIC